MEGLVSEGFVGLFVVSQEGHWSWKKKTQNTHTHITKKVLKYFGKAEPYRAEQRMAHTCATLV